MQLLMSLCVDLSHTRRGRQSVVKHAFVAGVKNLVHLICCLVKLSRFNNCLFSAWLGIRMIYGRLAVSPFSVVVSTDTQCGKARVKLSLICLRRVKVDTGGRSRAGILGSCMWTWHEGSCLIVNYGQWVLNERRILERSKLLLLTKLDSRSLTPEDIPTLSFLSFRTVFSSVLFRSLRETRRLSCL